MTARERLLDLAEQLRKSAQLTESMVAENLTLKQQQALWKAELAANDVYQNALRLKANT